MAVRELELDEQIIPLRTGPRSAGPAEVRRNKGRVRPLHPGEKIVGARGFLPFANKDIAHTLGAPVDMTRWIVNQVLAGATPRIPGVIEPGDVALPPNPVGGGQSIENLFNAIGIETPSQPPKTLPEYAGRAVGQTMSALLPMAPLTRLASGAKTVGGNIAGQINRAMTTPAGLTAELMAGAGAGAGEYVAAQHSEAPIARAMGSLAGGLTVGTATSAATRLMPTVMGIRLVRRAIFPFTTAGGQIRAADRVQGLSADSARAATALDQPTISNLTPAQRTDEPRLLALEQAVIETDPALTEGFATRTRDAANQLREALEAPLAVVPQGDARKIMDSRRTYLFNLVDTRTQQALSLAQQKLSTIPPAMRTSAASRVVRDELEKALGAARATERELWEAIPMEVRVPTTNATNAYKQVISTLSRAQMDDVPDVARQLLDPDSNARLGGEDAVLEVWGLRSKLLEVSRNARAAGNRNQARIADTLASALWDDLQGLSKAGDDSLNLALAYSKQLNERFTAGPIGRALGTERTGGQRVADELTLDYLMPSGLPGAVGAERLAAAVDTPETQRAVQQEIVNRFNTAAVREGRLNAQAASKFVNENADILDRYPDLRRDMRDAIMLQNRATRAEARSVSTRRSLTSPSQSYTAEFLNAPVNEEIDRIVRSADPASFAAELSRQAARDSSGRMGQSLAAGTVDYLIRKAGSSIDPLTQADIISGSKILSMLSDRRTRAAVDAFLSPAQISNIEKIAGELQRIERSVASRPTAGGIINDMPSSILDLMVRTVAARHGAQFGKGTSGASLLTAGFFSQRAKNLLGNLTRDKAKQIITDAITSGDQELLKILLLDISSPRTQPAAAGRFNDWLSGPGARYLTTNIVRVGHTVTEGKEE